MFRIYQDKDREAHILFNDRTMEWGYSVASLGNNKNDAVVNYFDVVTNDKDNTAIGATTAAMLYVCKEMGIDSARTMNQIVITTLVSQGFVPLSHVSHVLTDKQAVAFSYALNKALSEDVSTQKDGDE